MELHEIKYEDDGVALTGILADGSNGKLAPGILIAHEALGVGDHVKQRARMLAERGYIAFALDMYGAPDLPLEEAQSRSRALMADARAMRRRARAALEVLKTHRNCDSSRLAAVGFCLGGIVATNVQYLIHCIVVKLTLSAQACMAETTAGPTSGLLRR